MAKTDPKKAAAAAVKAAKIKLNAAYRPAINGGGAAFAALARAKTNYRRAIEAYNRLR